jgi:hypothetical protein
MRWLTGRLKCPIECRSNAKAISNGLQIHSNRARANVCFPVDGLGGGPFCTRRSGMHSLSYKPHGMDTRASARIMRRAVEQTCAFQLHKTRVG